jgi:hypothetical protein
MQMRLCFPYCFVIKIRVHRLGEWSFDWNYPLWRKLSLLSIANLFRESHAGKAGAVLPLSPLEVRELYSV